MLLPVTIRGGHVDYEAFERLGIAAGDMRTPLAAIGDRLLAGIGEQFATEGAWGGRPWAELNRNYRRWKETRVPGLPKLVGIKASGPKGQAKAYARSGKMRAELLAPHGYMVTRSRMAYTPTSDIAGFHQEGTTHMPERPPVVIPLRELQEWDMTFRTWVDGLITRALP